jgi:sucrose 6(F)-phosphate phosphorylase
MTVKNKVQLITYPDSLGGDLKTLLFVLENYFSDIFTGGIHILPPFPSSGDRGFAPLTYLKIEPKFGTWEDMRRIGEKYDILLDLMVNHISAKSEYFQDFLRIGRKSRYADLFLPLDKIWPEGEPSQEEIEKIFLRREEPYSSFTIKETGKTELIWTTFGKTNPSEQIDVDINSKITRELFIEFLENFGRNNIKMVRLDAIGYVVKKQGTSCFFVEPEIFQFLQWIAEISKSLDIEILPEVHSVFSIQKKLSEKKYWIYDFILPYIILDTMINGKSKKLRKYLKDRPSKQFTMLDCHDGIPLKPDLNGIYESENAKKVVEVCLARGGNLSFIYSPKHRDADGFDVHQIRGAYYSLLGCDDNAYLAARAIQFFTPGIPQVYYVGILAGKNDIHNMKNNKDGRVINRHNYNLKEIDLEMRKDVVQRLLKLIRFRNDYPAFNGEFTVIDTDPDKIHLKWEKDDKNCSLKIDLANKSSIIDYVNDKGQQELYIV